MGCLIEEKNKSKTRDFKEYEYMIHFTKNDETYKRWIQEYLINEPVIND